MTVKQISEAHQSGDEKSNFVIGGADVSNVYSLFHFVNQILNYISVAFFDVVYGFWILDWFLGICAWDGV